MKFSIVTLFPALYEPFLHTSLVHRAHVAGLVTSQVINLFDFSGPKARVDGPIFGPGTGVVLKPELIEKAIESSEFLYGPAYKIFFSPQGKKIDQWMLRSLLEQADKKKHIMFLPARYEGMDARVEEYYADSIVSLGDFVLMGGDLPAMVLMEGLLRLIPGVIGKQESIEHESFSGAFVDYPTYTEPVVWKDLTVPEVVRSGNHQKIAAWRQEQATEKTVMHHFDWLRSHVSSTEDRKRAFAFIPAHYVVLMHSQVKLPHDKEGTSSVTSIDIHDIARSAATYGIKKYYIVTPLHDQKRIINKLLSFWQTGEGIEYNIHRHEALARVCIVDNLDEALEDIEYNEKNKPVLLATGARLQDTSKQTITYYDQEKVWSEKRPVAFIFGTARGLGQSVISRCDFILEPVEGFPEFNHLSVRSAAAIIFDRWLGINRT
jgi:tRNA (guanine37-N1)-methyltransferase